MNKRNTGWNVLLMCGITLTWSSVGVAQETGRAESTGTRGDAAAVEGSEVGSGVEEDEDEAGSLAEGSSQPEATAGVESPIEAASVESQSIRQGDPIEASPLDLCALAPEQGASKYQRQRVLMFNAAVPSDADAPETIVDAKGNPVGTRRIFEEVRGGELARLSLFGALPMSRIHSVVVPQEAPMSLFEKDVLSEGELGVLLREDNFATYSAQCADWIAVPKLVRSSAEWKRVTKKKKVKQGKKVVEKEVPAWALDTSWGVSLALFKKQGKEFRRVDVLTSGSAGIDGFAGAAGSTEGDSGRSYHQYVSTWPSPDCAVGTAQDGRPGAIGSCNGLAPHFSVELKKTSMGTMGTCTPVEDAEGPAALKGLATCEILAAVARASHVAQRDWKRTDGFSLFAPLIVRGEIQAVAMGRSDSARRGDYYIATGTDASGEEVDLGYARIIRLGSGGDAGDGDPSQVKFKVGEAPPGTKMEEYSMLGAHLGVQPGALLLFAKGDLDTFVAPGGEIDMGYDLSKWIPFSDEFWSRGSIGYYAGSEDEGFVLVDAGLESVTISGGGTSWVLAGGLSVISATKKLAIADGGSISLNGGGAGAFVRAAWDYSFGVGWSARIGAEARSNFSSKELEDDTGLLTVDGGTLTGVKAFASFGHTM